MLAKEGLVVNQRCLGSVVCGLSERQWAGKVLLVQDGDFCSFHHTAVSAALSQRLSDAGYLVSHVVCPNEPGASKDLQALHQAIARPVSLAVVLFADRSVQETLERAGIDYLGWSKTTLRGAYCRGSYKYEIDHALKAFAEHCERRRVKTVLSVGTRSDELPNLAPHFTFNGIRLGFMSVPRLSECEGNDRISYAVMRAFEERLRAEGRKWFPDVMFFRDDFAARGGLCALMNAGVRIPEDLKVVTLANRGNLPVFPRTLARVEVDSTACGNMIADCVLGVLETSARRLRRTVSYRYVHGETFP